MLTITEYRDRSVAGEKRERPRASGRQLEVGRFGELEERARPGRSEQGLKTDNAMHRAGDEKMWLQIE